MGNENVKEWDASYGHGYYKHPTSFGTGGGGQYGGGGGGILTVNVDHLQIEGTITCSGEASIGSNSGGGSGGSVTLRVKKTFIGGGSAVSRGGDSTSGGGGGGGRMTIAALVPPEFTFHGVLDACGGFGVSSAHGSAGTMYYENEDRLVIDNCYQTNTNKM